MGFKTPSQMKAAATSPGKLYTSTSYTSKDPGLQLLPNHAVVQPGQYQYQLRPGTWAVVNVTHPYVRDIYDTPTIMGIDANFLKLFTAMLGGAFGVAGAGGAAGTAGATGAGTAGAGGLSAAELGPYLAAHSAAAPTLGAAAAPGALGAYGSSVGALSGALGGAAAALPAINQYGGLLQDMPAWSETPMQPNAPGLGSTLPAGADTSSLYGGLLQNMPSWSQTPLYANAPGLGSTLGGTWSPELGYSGAASEGGSNLFDQLKDAKRVYDMINGQQQIGGALGGAGGETGGYSSPLTDTDIQAPQINPATLPAFGGGGQQSYFPDAPYMMSPFAGGSEGLAGSPRTGPANEGVISQADTAGAGGMTPGADSIYGSPMTAEGLQQRLWRLQGGYPFFGAASDQDTIASRLERLRHAYF